MCCTLLQELVQREQAARASLHAVLTAWWQAGTSPQLPHQVREMAGAA
jgi:hypothetical protein